jgi:hypothetical protein
MTLLKGNDEITILSTNPTTVLSIYGGLGSDSFIITPQSNLGHIQGPLVISAGNSSFVNNDREPLMLPQESNDATQGHNTELIYEENQVDTIVFNHIDAQGDAEGTLTSSKLFGLGMVEDGIMYEGIELVEINFGKESSVLSINETSEAIHVVNLDSTGSSESAANNVVVRSLSGPMLINGGKGQDIVNVSSLDESKLDTIQALLMFDGGDDEVTDALSLDNSGQIDSDNLIIVTRLIVELDTMEVPEVAASRNNPILPRDSFLVTFRDSTGGSFSFKLDDPMTGRTAISTADLAYPTTADDIENAIDSTLIPEADKNSCGKSGTSQCSSTVRVWQLGKSDTFVIIFVGERLNAGVSLSLISTKLQNFNGEIFHNETSAVIMKNSDVAYTNVDELRITLGYQGDVVGNIRGTTADTYIETQGGDDKFFIASDANENQETALTASVLYGVLDYIEGDLHIDLKGGSHRLLVSDCFSAIPKGVGAAGPVEITNASIENLGDDVGNIYFTTSSNDWLGGVVMWFGKGNDLITVKSVPTLGSTASRTTTSLHAGKGNDIITIELKEGDNVGALFIANGQDGDDSLDGTASTVWRWRR